MYQWDLYQVFLTLNEFSSCDKTIIPEGMLLQIYKYSGTTIAVKSEEGKKYRLLASDILNTENFKKIF